MRLGYGAKRPVLTAKGPAFKFKLDHLPPHIQALELWMCHSASWTW